MHQHVHRFQILITAAALLAVLLACAAPPMDPLPLKPQLTHEAAALGSPDPQEKPGAPLRIKSVQLLRGTADLAVKNFTTGDRVQYFDVQLTDFIPSGTRVKWVFTAVDTSAGKNIKLGEIENTVALTNHISTQFSPGVDFLAGKYRVDIFANQEKMGTIEYIVASH